MLVRGQVAEIDPSSTSVRPSVPMHSSMGDIEVTRSGHPCNMKEFRVYIGLTEDNMVEVLSACLRDDAIPETFSIRSTNTSGDPLPSRYVRIEPLS